MSYYSDFKHGAITQEEYDQFAAEENYADKVDQERAHEYEEEEEC